MRRVEKFLVISLLTGLCGGISLPSPVLGAKEEHGEAHHSLLHILFKVPVVERVVPQPGKQPDLILNTFFLIVVLTVGGVLLTRRLKRLPETQGQNFIEFVVEKLTGFFEGILGESGKRYVPFVGSFFLTILLLNLLGLLPGLQSPTADLNTTLGFALVAVLGVQIIAIRELGFLNYLKHFVGEPWWLGPLMFPLHLIGEISRILSLSIRLFGNIFGEDMIIIILAGLSPVLLVGHQEIPYLPLQLPMMLFGLFTSFVQALVFSVLTSIYIVTFIGDHHGEEHHH
jgi:F-type H+-transporting ATPase subunit a